MVRADEGQGVPEGGQAGGESVGLPGVQRGDRQTAGQEPVEERTDLPRLLQPPQHGNPSADPGPPEDAQPLQHRELGGVHHGPRPQEAPCGREELLDVVGQTPVG
ncbi:MULTISPECIES: hypothetical protein [unclassified Streptomyces]|uniref:hypothetical protein n=1 Tax=unclassified Streptomyces TaxID=2593676 RepID=UPI003812B0BE